MLNFHKAELSDAQDVAALINSAYRGESSRAGWTTEADILDGLRTTTQEVASIIQREDAFILVGVLRDEIVATVCCERQDAYGRNIAHFGMIAVKPTLQNKGHGTTMLQAAEAMTLREWRVVGFHMAVITLREELIAFYERLGYLRSGEFKKFPEDSVLWQPKVPDLTLEYLVKIIKR
jgi:ribosomal protein S18 acetylase RimI-like enzyme